MRKYETIFVVDSLLKGDEIESIVSKYERFISANGGKIEDIEHWGKKRLAYEIKKRQYGYYVLIRFEGPPTMIKTLEREYRLNESLLRYKTLAMEKASIAAAERANAEEAKAEEKEAPAKTETAAETSKETPAKEETPTEEKPTEEKPTEEKPAEETPAEAETSKESEEASEETPDVNEEEKKEE